MKKFHCVRNKCLVFQHLPRITSHLRVCTQAFLHCLLRIVKKIYTHRWFTPAMIYTILVDIDSNVVKWPKTLHLIREGYFQGMVEGNECRRLLKSIPHLRSILLKVWMHSAPSFQWDIVDIPKLRKEIAAFRQHWKQTGLKLIPKVHIICDHLFNFIELHEGKNSHLYSGHSHESLHRDFKKRENGERSDTNSEVFHQHLYQAVLEFNGLHGY